MRIILLLILSIVFSVHAIGQSVDHIQKDRDGNVSAIFGNQNFEDNNVAQMGTENMFFIYSIPYGSAGDVEARQRGFSNRIISVIAEGKGSFLQGFDQKGERNNIQVLHRSTSDSTRNGLNKIDIKQKGSENSVTIIQQ